MALLKTLLNKEKNRTAEEVYLNTIIIYVSF